MKTNLPWVALLAVTFALPCLAQTAPPPPPSSAPPPPATQPGADLEPGPLTPWLTGPGANGKSYQAFAAPKGITWQDAETFSESRGGHLATIHSDEENIFVFNLVNDPKYWVSAPQPGYIWGPWLGGMKRPDSKSPADGWEWVNNEGPFAYTAWRHDQPDNDAGLENRLDYLASSLTTRRPDWNDERPNAAIHGFIVEYGRDPASLPAAPPPSGLAVASPAASPPPVPPAAPLDPFAPAPPLAPVPSFAPNMPAAPPSSPNRPPVSSVSPIPPPVPPPTPAPPPVPPPSLGLIVAVAAVFALFFTGIFILIHDRRSEKREMAERENHSNPG